MRSEELEPFQKGSIFDTMTNLRPNVSLCLTRAHDVISSSKWLLISKTTKESTRIQIHANNTYQF